MPVAVEVAPPVGRRGTAGGHLLERELGLDRRDDLVLGDDLVVDPVTGRVERHELDEAHLDVVVATEAGEVERSRRR